MFTNYFWHRDLIQLFSIDCHKTCLNWLRTSSVVSVTIAATWHIWTADFWADFERRYLIILSYARHSTFYASLWFIRKHKMWNDAQLRIATVTRFSWYFAAQTIVFFQAEKVNLWNKQCFYRNNKMFRGTMAQLQHVFECRLSALTQPHCRSATRLLPCRW